MLREDVFDAAISVSRLLREAKLPQVLGPKQKPGLSVEAIESMQVLSRGEQNLTPAARELIKIFDIESVFKPEFWFSLASEDTNTVRNVQVETRWSVRTAIYELPKVAALLVRSADSIDQAPVGVGEDGGQAITSKLTMVLPEDHGVSSPKRVAVALEAVSSIYEVCCILRGEDASTLALAACDSGSDKIFDFTGIDGVLREVKELLVSFWDRIVFVKEKKASSAIELIGSALPILEEIEEKKNSGVIGPEQAELLKRRVMSAATGIKDTGALLRESDSRYREIDVRKLSAPSQKLLVGPQVESMDEFSGEDESMDLNFEDHVEE